jgi:hypothetical protein
MNFERGGDIIKNMDIGLNASPSPGRKFFVRFRLRESRADYYPLQRMEERGEPILATCIEISEISGEMIKCHIEGINHYLWAHKNNEEWIID